jgi:FlaG/FlaF family flagellin (archaellin)
MIIVGTSRIIDRGTMMSVPRKSGDYAVSPVVGVMLMLVVTIIIAAVVSGFSGSLMGGSSQKAPTLAMDVKIANTGSWAGSGFSATVTGASEVIPTSKLKLTTSWHATNHSADSSGEPLLGGATVLGATTNLYNKTSKLTEISTVNGPYGFGPGVSGDVSMVPPYTISQMFGNYTLAQGTGLVARPAGASSDADEWGAGSSEGYGIDDPFDYNIAYDSSNPDPAQQVLGRGWENLRAGDIVTVNIIYVPTGKVILSKDIAVTG